MITFFPAVISALALLLTPLAGLTAADPGSSTTSAPEGENWWSQPILNTQKSSYVGSFQFENTRPPLDVSYECEEGALGYGYWADNLINCDWNRGSALFDTFMAITAPEDCAAAAAASAFLNTEDEIRGFRETCEGLLSGGDPQQLWEELGWTQLYGSQGLVTADPQFTFLGLKAVPVAFKKYEENMRTVAFTNTSNEPWTVSAFNAEVAEHSFEGDSETHQVIPGGTSVLTNAVDDFEIAPGETKIIEFATVDPLVSVVRTFEGGITGYGNVTRVSVEINGETLWFDEHNGFGSVQPNGLAADYEESTENLFPTCGVEAGFLSIGYCGLLTNPTVSIRNSWFDVTWTPEQPVCPPGTHEISRWTDGEGNVHLNCAPDSVPVDPGTPVDPTDPGTPTTPVDPVDPQPPVTPVDPTDPVTPTSPVQPVAPEEVPGTPATAIAATVLAQTGTSTGPLLVAGMGALVLLLAGAGVLLVARKKA